ncbi:hypothetical protein ACQ5SB_04185 [Stenotrophomonas geniculata]|uniref:hypothetical protein n=2 Tax=Stenotrophomonas TaxID=40323 RepID=UPI003D3399FC
MARGKYQERLRIDPVTPTSTKGPNYCHYQLDQKCEHFSPAPGDRDPELQWMNEDFNALEWCDATLLAINIDRSNPGVCDEVKVQIRWPDGRMAIVCFSEAYGCSALMNFGVLGDEGIEFAMVDDDEPGLADLLDRWKAVGYPLSGLKCFRIETSSTGSVILIYARTWRIENQPMADAAP